MTTPTTTDLCVTGNDAKDFLQGQLSNDLYRLDKDPQMLSAWCTPKGRVISVFTVRRGTEGYVLQVPTELAQDLLKRLTLFRFRAKVDFALSATHSPHDAVAAIAAGLPWIGREQTEKFTPHMLNLDLLDGISLDKGCYTGQEIVARTHYKGATRRRTVRFESEQPLAVGNKVALQGRDLGEVLNVAGNDLLAVVPVKQAQEALTVSDIALSHKPLPYLS